MSVRGPLPSVQQNLALAEALDQLSTVHLVSIENVNSFINDEDRNKKIRSRFLQYRTDSRRAKIGVWS